MNDLLSEFIADLNGRRDSGLYNTPSSDRRKIMHGRED